MSGDLSWKRRQPGVWTNAAGWTCRLKQDGTALAYGPDDVEPRAAFTSKRGDALSMAQEWSLREIMRGPVVNLGVDKRPPRVHT